jgi:hypothetical protein
MTLPDVDYESTARGRPKPRLAAVILNDGVSENIRAAQPTSFLQGCE